MYPGVDSKPFFIKFDHDWLNKNDIIKGGKGQELIVLKVYKLTKWRKFLLWLGRKTGIDFKVKFFEAKVKIKNDSKSVSQ